MGEPEGLVDRAHAVGALWMQQGDDRRTSPSPSISVPT